MLTHLARDDPKEEQLRGGTGIQQSICIPSIIFQAFWPCCRKEMKKNYGWYALGLTLGIQNQNVFIIQPTNNNYTQNTPGI